MNLRLINDEEEEEDLNEKEEEEELEEELNEDELLIENFKSQ